MTDKKMDDNIVDGEVVVTDTTEKKSSKMKGAKSSNIGLTVLLLAAIGSGVGAGFWGWQLLLQQQNNTVQLQQQIQQQQSKLSSFSQLIASVQADEQAELQAVKQQFLATQQRLDSQNKRLLSISTTTKEDWQLLEARYLLRLANQRLMTERDSAGSVALLQAADNILRDLDDSALFAIRQSVAQDIAALKLAPSIDRDGVYLRLVSLADNLKQLPAIKPMPGPVLESQLNLAPKTVVEVSPENAVNQSVWQRIQQRGLALLDNASEYVRVRHHDAPLLVLPPESQMYVTQNLRLNLEQAQLALLGEEQQIYQGSLAQTAQLLRDYYQLNNQVEVFIEEVELLQALKIRRNLPGISGSLGQLDAYIERLHKLAPNSKSVTPASASVPVAEES